MATTPEQKKKNIERVLLGVGALVALAVSAPIIILATQALIGLLIAIPVGLAIINFTPVVAQKMANWRLKAMKAEAAKNPVEELQNKYVKKQEALDKFRENIRTFTAQVLSFADKVKEYDNEGLDDAETYKQQLAKMKKLLELRNRKFQEAQASLVEFSKTIERTDRKWKMALAADKMNEAAGEMAGDAFDKICIETALDSVQTKLNEAFADLEISLLDDDKDKAKEKYKAKQEEKDLVNREVSPRNTNSTRQAVQ